MLRPVNSQAEYGQLVQDYKIWRDYNIELLTSIFEGDGPQSDTDLIALAQRGGVPLSRSQDGKLVVRLRSGDMALRDAIKAGLVVIG